MSSSQDHNSYYAFIKKGDLIRYAVEVFEMSVSNGFIIEEEKYLGIVVSDLIEYHQYGNIGGITTLGHPYVESIDLPYFKIYCIEKQEIIFIQFDKIEIL